MLDRARFKVRPLTERDDMFCPRCGDEFVPGITVCPDCELSLVDAPAVEKIPELGDGDERVTVATFPNIFDASVAKGALEAGGVDAFVPGENVGSFSRVPQHEILVGAEGQSLRPGSRRRASEASGSSVSGARPDPSVDRTPQSGGRAPRGGGGGYRTKIKITKFVG